MIVVCELLPGGGVYQYDYPDFSAVLPHPDFAASLPDVPPWGTPLEWAMRIAGLVRRDLQHPSWIEHRDHPASFPTIEQAQRRLLRWSRPEGTH